MERSERERAGYPGEYGERGGDRVTRFLSSSVSDKSPTGTTTIRRRRSHWR